ncbi:hypothetical protein GALMADRAFT_209920 [Galerina marginata CBS 339.88]|uniref:Uncharacterized protein n=1 Tax=Galerina marginata (strain CBS 339.88) TaxID=685588 RepID=A0A067TCK7_GALM3|nr:hypothetical protein GALMADRAFT_209920 [Galerina marginata CBS 339.88]
MASNHALQKAVSSWTCSCESPCIIAYSIVDVSFFFGQRDVGVGAGAGQGWLGHVGGGEGVAWVAWAGVSWRGRKGAEKTSAWLEVVSPKRDLTFRCVIIEREDLKALAQDNNLLAGTLGPYTFASAQENVWNNLPNALVFLIDAPPEASITDQRVLSVFVHENPGRPSTYEQTEQILAMMGKTQDDVLRL